MISKETSIAIFGLGLSGLATTKWLVENGYAVVAWDDNEAAREKAAAYGAELAELDEERLRDSQLLVLAPGVPLTHPEPHTVVKAAHQAGTEVICDIELFFRLYAGIKTVGITGTNGKSTTTALLTHTLNECGVRAKMGGNIGKPIFEIALEDGEALVLELSSYQLDLCPTFTPDISVLLNITPDHLDRHGTMQHYAAVKAKIFNGPGEAVVTGEDQYSQDILETYILGRRDLLELPSEGDVHETKTLRGAHNVQNMRACMAVCRSLGLADGDIRAAFETFPGLPHRQYFVGERDGITFINDSKATNAESAAKALGAYENIYWILGGQEKEGGLQGLEGFVPRVRAAFVIGEAAEADGFSDWLSHQGVTFQKSMTLEQAVKDALAQIDADRTAGKVEDCVVLLSPACASWDQFKNFEDRGEQFVTLSEKLFLASNHAKAS